MRGFGWVAVVPVKRLPLAKSRLRGALAGVAHERLVVAMALDTVTAVLASPRVVRVLVVTDDPVAGPALAELGAERVGPEPAGGLNPALAHGAAGLGPRVVALTADLPALRPTELSAALDAAERLATGPLRAYVADAGGRGTALLAALGGAALGPRFGPASAAAHAASGAVRLDGHWPSLRRDVDTAADLAAATALGLGPYTADLVETTVFTEEVLRVQGTVATFDDDTGAGTVLLDDGTELAFEGAAFARSGLRLLRMGQRVRLERDEAGTIVELSLPTMR